MAPSASHEAPVQTKGEGGGTDLCPGKKTPCEGLQKVAGTGSDIIRASGGSGRSYIIREEVPDGK